jgi:hypothetical protein
MPNFSGIWTVTQQMQAKGQSIWPDPPLVIGQVFGGGYFAGQISTAGNGIADYNLVVGPLASAESSLAWKNAGTTTAGADSVINGPQNTADMVADGNSTVYPAAHFCNNLSTGGQTDWYMPSKNELEVCYYNLKPSTTSNLTNSGINANSVPARASNYTTGDPSQTSATVFQTGGAEAFTATIYWASTERTSSLAWNQNFTNGNALNNGYKYNSYRVRAVRRVAV